MHRLSEVSMYSFPRKFGKAAQTASQYGAAAKIIGVGLGANRSSAGQRDALRGHSTCISSATPRAMYPLRSNITSVAIIFNGPELPPAKLAQMDGYPHPGLPSVRPGLKKKISSEYKHWIPIQFARAACLRSFLLRVIRSRLSGDHAGH